jgi:hypothetical protein
MLRRFRCSLNDGPRHCPPSQELPIWPTLKWVKRLKKAKRLKATMHWKMSMVNPSKNRKLNVLWKNQRTMNEVCLDQNFSTFLANKNVCNNMHLKSSQQSYQFDCFNNKFVVSILICSSTVKLINSEYQMTKIFQFVLLQNSKLCWTFGRTKLRNTVLAVWGEILIKVLNKKRISKSQSLNYNYQYLFWYRESFTYLFELNNLEHFSWIKQTTGIMTFSIIFRYAN